MLSFLKCFMQIFVSDLVRQLHREFLRGGADVMQAFTFSLEDDLGGEHAKYGVCMAVYCMASACSLFNIMCTLIG